jgi:hypothetical protein
LTELAVALGTPSTTFSEALSVARGARPDLAATVDHGRFATTSTAPSPARSGPPRPATLDAHHSLLALAEQLTAADPTLTPELAYAVILNARDDLRARLATEGHQRAQSLALGERARAARCGSRGASWARPALRRQMT